MKRRLKWVLLLACAGALLGCLFWSTARERADLEQIRRFAGGDLLEFQAEYGPGTVTVQMTLAASFPDSAVIRYTTDGSTPTEESPVYSEPLVFDADWSRLPVVRAVVYCGDEQTECFTRTFPAEAEMEFPENMRILLISTEEENLYSYETGILVEGKTKDDYIATHDDYDQLPTWQQPANYRMRGEDWIRPAHVEILDNRGNLLGQQDVGLSVAGGASATRPVKSLRLAAKWVNPDNKDFPAAWGDFPVRGASLLTMPGKYNKIVAKNGGQDRFSTFLITQVVYPQAVAAGFDATPDCVPALVYLDGVYYSYAILQPDINRDYLGNLFGLDKDQIEFKKTTENSLIRSDRRIAEALELEPGDPEGIGILKCCFELDQLLRYYAFEMVCNNRDVLSNNYGVWRWTGEENPNNPYTDGRWRFVLYDVDRAYAQDNQDAFLDILPEEGYLYSRLFHWILADEGCRERFLNICQSLVNVTLSPETVTAGIDRMRALQLGWMENPQVGDLIRTSFSEIREKTVAFFRQNASVRRDVVFRHLCSLLELGTGTCALELTGDAASAVELGGLTLPLGRTWSLTWLTDNPATLKALIAPGRVFRCWRVNGVEYPDEALRLDWDLLAAADPVRVELVTEPVEGPLLEVNEISARGDMDWVELKNVGSAPMDLGGLYISNRETKPNQCGLPWVVLEPGERIVLNCKNNMTLMGYLLNFNFSAGEHLYVNRADGTALLDFRIPYMGENETYGLDPATGKHVFYETATKGEENPTLYDSLN